MKLISFGPDSLYLMDDLLGHAGTGAADASTVAVTPRADAAVRQLLEQAAAGGWIVEILDVEDAPNNGEGDMIELTVCTHDEIAGRSLDEAGNWDRGFLRLDISKIDKIHIF